MNDAKRKYEKLRQLIQEQNKIIPFVYHFKFICDSTPQLEDSLSKLEQDFPELRLATKRLSARGNHVAITYTLLANSSDEIIDVLLSIEKVHGLKMIL